MTTLTVALTALTAGIVAVWFTAASTLMVVAHYPGVAVIGLVCVEAARRAVTPEHTAQEVEP